LARKLDLGRGIDATREGGAEKGRPDFDGDVAREQRCLIIPTFYEAPRVKRNRQDGICAQIVKAASSAQQFAEGAREMRAVFVFEPPNGDHQRAAVVTERNPPRPRRTALDARRAPHAKRLTSFHDAGTRCTTARAQELADQPNQHERGIVQTAASVASDVATSAGGTTEIAGAFSASVVTKGRHSSSVRP